MWAICKRELQAYFFTPVGYVFLAVFALISGIIFAATNLVFNQTTSLSSMFNAMCMFVLMIAVPILTMRLFSEERRNRSEQLLLTSPASLFAIVMGKFLAACLTFLVGVAVTFIYVIIIDSYGTLPVGETITNYIGFILVGASLISLGVLMSAVTENQAVSGLVTFGIILLIYLLNMIAPQLNMPYFSWLPGAIAWLSIFARFNNFNTGALIPVADVVFFLSFCAVLLFLTGRVIEKRRWSEG